MSYEFGTRVWENCTAEGLEDLSLTGAISDLYRAFNDELSPSASTFTYYVILDGTQIEWGMGTFSSASVLERTTVLGSSTGGKLSLSTNSKTVLLSAPGDKHLLLDTNGVVIQKGAVRGAVILETAAAMKALDFDDTADDEHVIVRELTAGNGNGGVFYLDKADATAPDDLDTFRPDGESVGLWKRVFMRVQDKIFDDSFEINTTGTTSTQDFYAQPKSTNPNDRHRWSYELTGGEHIFKGIARGGLGADHDWITVTVNGDDDVDVDVTPKDSGTFQYNGVEIETVDPTTTSIKGLTMAADEMIYWTGVDTAAKTTITTAARGLLDDADATAMRSTLGVVIGTDVQAQNAFLQTLAGSSEVAESSLSAAVQAKLNQTFVNKLDATAAPTTDDDGGNTSGNGSFQVGSIWVDITNDKAYRCVDATIGAAVWVDTTLSSSDLGDLATQTSSGITLNLIMAETDGPAILNETPSSTNPVLTPSKNDALTGVGWESTGIMHFIVDSQSYLEINRTDGVVYCNAVYGFVLDLADGPGLVRESPSATNPNVVPDRSDLDTGLGHPSANALSLIVGGLEGLRVTSGQMLEVKKTDYEDSVTDDDHIPNKAYTDTRGASKNALVMHCDNVLVNSTSFATLALATSEIDEGAALSRSTNDCVISEDGLYIFSFSGMFQDYLDSAGVIYPDIKIEYSTDDGGAWTEYGEYPQAGGNTTFASNSISMHGMIVVSGTATNNWRIRVRVKKVLAGLADFRADNCRLIVWKQWD